MTIDELYTLAREATAHSPTMCIPLVIKRGQRRPAGFPRGELLAETAAGRVYSVKAARVMRWIEDNKLLGQQAR